MCNTQKNSLLPKQKLHPKRWSQGTIRLCGHTTQHKTSTYNFVAPSLHNQVSTSQYHKRLTSHNFTTVETVALLGCGKRIMPFRRNTMFPPSRSYYRGADKSLARPWTDTSYRDQTHNTIPIITANKQQQYIAAVCTPYVLV